MEYLKDIQSGQDEEKEIIVLESERFVSMDDVHIGVEKYKYGGFSCRHNF